MEHLLDVEEYHRLGAPERRVVDDWLAATGLDTQRVVSIERLDDGPEILRLTREMWDAETEMPVRVFIDGTERIATETVDVELGIRFPLPA